MYYNRFSILPKLLSQAINVKEALMRFLCTVVAPWDSGGHLGGLSPPSGSPSQADPQEHHCRAPQEDHPREWWVILDI